MPCNWRIMKKKICTQEFSTNKSQSDPKHPISVNAISIPFWGPFGKTNDINFVSYISKLDATDKFYFQNVLSTTIFSSSFLIAFLKMTKSDKSWHVFSNDVASVFIFVVACELGPRLLSMRRISLKFKALLCKRNRIRSI